MGHFVELVSVFIGKLST